MHAIIAKSIYARRSMSPALQRRRGVVAAAPVAISYLRVADILGSSTILNNAVLKFFATSDENCQI
eukprot:6207651-Pleurochrysis_carterae.AAC.10